MIPKIIKSSRFADGTYTITAPPCLPDKITVVLDGDGITAVDPVLAAAADASRQIVAAAHGEAAQILAQAQATADALATQTHDELAQEAARVREDARAAGHEAGMLAGTEAGKQAAFEAQADQLATLAGAHVQAQTQRQEWFERQEKDLVKLAILIAQKLLCLELAHSRTAALPMAQAALGHITDRSKVRLRVHPLDLAAVTAAKASLMLSVDSLTHLEVVADPKVGLSGCMVETRTGLVDARLATQLAEVAAGLLEIKPGPDGLGEMDPVVLAAIRALGQAVQQPVNEPTPATQYQLPAAPLPLPVPLPAPMPPPKPEVQAIAPIDLPEPTEVQTFADAAAAPEEFSPADPAPADEEHGASPDGHMSLEPEEESTPISASPPPEPQADPTIHAARVLAARLGQLRQGRIVPSPVEQLAPNTVSPDHVAALLEAFDREASAAKGTVSELDIPLDIVLVANPPAMEDITDALAERLGKKRRRRPGPSEIPEEVTAAQLAEFDTALSDSVIDQIMNNVITVVPPAEGEKVPLPPASIESASENLARLLGKTKNKGNRSR